MNLAYTGRLLCLCLASFFFVNLAAGVAASALANTVCGLARRMRARVGVRLLLALRLAPVVLGVSVLACVCVPSYLWMEPDSIDEPVGWPCLLVGALAVLTWLLSAVRATRAAILSRRYLRRLAAREQTLRVSGESFSVLVSQRRELLFALAGILRPRLMLSECALRDFPEDELLSALRHEQAHGESHDNLKRFLMLLAPDILPFVPTLRRIERAWAGLAEWAADDRASGGNPRRSVSLASALVRAARTGTSSPQPDLVTALLADGQDLSVRVDRLLRNTAASEEPRGTWACAAGALVFTAFALSALLHPASLAFAHVLLERLVR